MADSISIISSPPAIALIDEGLKFTLERNSGGVTDKADLTIGFPNNQTLYLDKFFEVALPDRTLRFYFKTTPDESGLQLGTWTAGLSLAQFLAIVMDDIQKNYYINKDYTVDIITGTLLKITARNIGTAYNLQLGDTDVDGLSENDKTAGIDDATPADFRIYVAVCNKADGLDYAVPLGEDFLPVDTDGIAQANVAEYLKDQIVTGFTFPYNGLNIVEHAQSVIKYYIRYAEFYSETFRVLYNNYPEIRYALPGGLKQIDSDYLDEEGSDYFSFMENATRFLSWAPLSKVTYPDMPERLYFFTQASGLKIMAKLHYSIVSNEVEIQPITSAAYTVIEILCGVGELFVGHDVSDLQSYEIWIADSDDTAVSEVRNFVVDHRNFLNKRTLIFKNSFTQYDILNCTGDLSISDGLKREEMEVLTNDTFRRKVSQAENTAVYILSSGWVNDQASRLWLEELQLSKEVFFVLGNALLPVLMKTTKVVRSKDREHNYSLKITFEPDYRDERYSRIVGDGLFNLADENKVVLLDENNKRLFTL